MQKGFIKVSSGALVLSLILAACGGGGEESTTAAVASTSSSSTAAATSSKAASSAAAATSSTAAATSSAAAGGATVVWSEAFNQADETAFFATTTPAAYAKTGGTITVTGGAITINQGRFVIGTADITASTATAAPTGTINFAGKTTCTATFDVSAITLATAAKSLILYVNNSTSSSALSPLGAASKVGAIDSSTLVVGTANTITWTNTAGANSFMQLRTETGANVSLNSASVSCS